MIPELVPDLRGTAECANCNKRVKCFTITGVAGATVGWLAEHGCPHPWGGSPTVSAVSPGVEPCDFNHGSTTTFTDASKASSSSTATGAKSDSSPLCLPFPAQQ